MMKIRVLAAAVAVAACDVPLDSPAADQGAPNIPAAGNVQLAPAEQVAYTDAAGVLALREVERALPQHRDEIELPAELVASLYNALVRVHAFRHPARDSVISLYRVRVFPNPPVRTLMVGLDDAAPWVARWREGVRLTGEPRIDSLVVRHDLTLVRDFGAFVTLRTGRPLNVRALAARFDGIPGVRWAEPDGFVGDGHDIRAERRGGGWRLAYSVGFGDCPAGCIERTTWTFDVAPSGAVSYRGRTGPAPPPAP